VVDAARFGHRTHFADLRGSEIECGCPKIIAIGRGAFKKLTKNFLVNKYARTQNLNSNALQVILTIR
jgi:hypothetical protein